jgi:hypothetical protein
VRGVTALCVGTEESAQVDAEMNTFGEAPDDAEDARKRFEEHAVRGLEQLRSDSELGGELNAALAQAVGLDPSKISPELQRKLEEVAKRESQAEPPPLPRG